MRRSAGDTGLTGWLRQCLEGDRTRLLNSARDAAGTPGWRMATRLAMDQVSGIISTLKIIDLAEDACVPRR
jgi:hypothetical protein